MRPAGLRELLHQFRECSLDVIGGCEPVLRFLLQKAIDQGPFIGEDVFIDSWYSRPDFFREPRRVVLGASVRF